MESTTLGGTIKQVARDEIEPATREGRVSQRDGSVLLVSVRSLTGDTRPIPARGWAPRLSAEGELERVLPAKDDPVWVAEDEGGGLVVVAWEPK